MGVTVKTTGSMSFQINAIEVNWDERTRRVELPCAKCGKPTKGRADFGGGLKKPYHMSCASTQVIDKAMAVYRRRDV